MGARYIEVFEARWSEVEWMIKKNINKDEEGAKKDDAKFEPSDFVVRIRGLPFEADKEEIRMFFKDIDIPDNGILLCYDFQNRKSGQAFVTFNDKEGVEKA